MPWKPAPCGVKLSEQLDERYGAERTNDGTIASAQHSKQNPDSDHEIDREPDGSEWVDARDVYDWRDLDANALMHRLALSRDRRIKYVISHGQMCSSYPTSRYPAWTWRPYKGPNGHFHHGHISFVDEHRQDTSPWDIGGAVASKPTPTAQEDDVLYIAIDDTTGDAWLVSPWRRERKPLEKDELTLAGKALKVLRTSRGTLSKADLRVLASYKEVA